ncbi:MAG: DNA repair protein RadA [Elusimicrobia bacterium]|nr:DNA repair protein RadA [Elusimicrobiota bacterium]
MGRLKSLYRCQECGYSAPKPLGQCPDCSAWNTMIEEVVESRPQSAAGSAARRMTEFSSEVTALSEAAAGEETRRCTGIAEFDRLLGGGVVPGQVILLAGPPGIGKSTLMLQAASRLAVADARNPVLYVSGEESLRQVSARAKRLGVADAPLLVVSETDLSRILAAAARLKPGLIVLDSVQTVFHPELSSGPGSVAQVRECAAELLRLAKATDAAVFLLGHVTKEGSLAGPKVLEHIVDTVLYFDTERHDLLRVLRAQKNRFGPTDELGLFEMGERGLRELGDASAFFLADRAGRPQAGRAPAVTLEGSRAMMVEVQGLVVHTKYPLPRRMATGLDLNRVLVLLAAMEKHLSLRLEAKDVFVSLAGGLRIKDPAVDLAVCMAILSSARDIPVAADTVLLGEVGLLGDVGRVPRLEARLKEAAKAGLRRAVVPERSLQGLSRKPDLELVGVPDLASAAALLSQGRKPDHSSKT